MHRSAFTTPLRCWFTILVIFLIVGCSPAPTIPVEQPITASPPAAEPKITQGSTLTPFQPLPTLTSTPKPALSLWIDPAVPEEVRKLWPVPPEIQIVPARESANLFWEVNPESETGLDPVLSVVWIYALVAPFPTVTDGESLSQIQAFWKGQDGHPLLMNQSTREIFSRQWGNPKEGAVEILATGDLAQKAWDQRPVYAIIPFQDLAPSWKVLTVDGLSPLAKEFQEDVYPLKAVFQLRAKTEQAAILRKALQLEPGKIRSLTGNRDSNQMTVLVMTGVTALVRVTAWKMEANGINYPGRDIRDVLRNADITHISNEVAFAQNCPPPDPASSSLRFCSDPKYIGLLEDIGTKVVELSGNHVNDWGTDALSYTLKLYQEHHIPYFAGGANEEEARRAVILEDHGNRLAFIGCNPAGPSFAWATDSTPGSARCDYDWETAEIRRLRSQGILPIVTFQYQESYDPSPLPPQQKDFRSMIDAGAAIVSGSQAHYPQGFELYQGSLIHYGLGNLFFDQQNYIDPYTGNLVEGTRWEFVDRHIIYQGRHISTELLTYMLEDWSRPRPMTAQEREALLKYIFAASGWK